MKIVINAPFTKEELIALGNFLREMWKDTSEKCFVSIVEGMENMSKEECLKVLRKIFTESPEYHEIVISKGEVEEFYRRTR